MAFGSSRLLGIATLLLLTTSQVHALDAGPWDEVLQAHASPRGFDYAGLAADAESQAKLDAFLQSVARMPESEGLASWLNAYNAIVVKAVVSRHPLTSVRDVDGFFDSIRYRVAGAQRTLDDIENRIVRPRFRDARVHFALNCGARSCPALHTRAFRESTLNRTLDRLVRSSLRKRIHLRRDGSALRVSEIFFWFEEDFTRDGSTVLQWIQSRGPEALRSLPATTELGRIRYDWRLNQS